MKNEIVQVVTPPAPFVTPAEIRGATAGDTYTEALIAAVTRSIAAPTGWLGRSLGEQTLEWSCDRWPARLPYGPIVSVESVKYTDADGNEQTVPEADYRLVGHMLLPAGEKFWPPVASQPDAVRIRYVAGYDEVPAEARHAVILAVQHLADLGATETFLRSETVEGVGTFSYSISSHATEQVRKATESLLAGLRLWR